MDKPGSTSDQTRSKASEGRSVWVRPWLGLVGLALPLAALPVRADVQAAGGARSLGTMVNGQAGGRCVAGPCEVSGGTGAGRNLFHRFTAFDTRGAIAGVRIQSDGYRNVLVGVTHPTGSFIDKAVALSSRGNLFWLSPGGIQISGAGGFQNVQHLQLSTATGLRFGGGVWDALRSTSDQVALLQDDPIRGVAGLFTDAGALHELGLQGNGDLHLDGGTLTVEESLLLDSQGGNVLMQAAGLQAPGGVVELSGREVLASNTAVDVSQPDGIGGRVAISGERVQITGGRLDASGQVAGGEVSLEAVQDLTLTATDVVVRGGAAASAPVAEAVAPAAVAPPPTPIEAAATVDAAPPIDVPAATAAATEVAVAQVDTVAEGAGVAAPTASAVEGLAAPVEVAPAVEVAADATTEPQVQPSVLEPPAPLNAPVHAPAPEGGGGRGGRIRLRGQQVVVVGGLFDASGGQAEGSVSLHDGSSGSWQQPESPQEPPLAEVLAVQAAVPLAAPGTDQAAPGAGGSVSIEAGTVTQNTRIAVSGTSGGAVAITARESLISGAPVEASGSSGSGGLISLQAGLNLFQGQTSWLMANGVSAGGVIQVIGGQLLETSGRYQAIGFADQGVGGLIELTGRSVTLDGVSADASGGAAGGVIHVGGAERGADLQSGGAIADTVSVRPGSTLVADAVRRGDGGRVIVYADNAAVIDGQLSVRGGSEAGNGGFVETSADRLAVDRAPRLDADAGRAGTWLIDPTDLRISAAGGLPTSPSLIGAVSYVAASALNSALNSDGAHVILETSASGTGAGNLFIDSPIALSAATGPSSLDSKLTLKAHGDIYIDANISGANFRPLNVDLIADSDATGGGGVQWGSATLDLKGGTATVLKAVPPGLSPASVSPTTLGDLTIKPLSSATLATNSSLQTGSLSLQSGTLQVNGILSVDGHYQQSGGTLSGTGAVNLNGSGSWTGGAITGTGTLRIASSKSFAISAGQGAFEAFGSVSYVGSLTDFLYSGAITSGASTTISPQQGASMLKIAPLAALAGDLTQFLGIDKIALDRFTSPEFATTGSGIRFNLAAGDVLSYDWYFASVDYIPFYDAGFYVVSDGTPVDLARVGSANANQWKSSQYVASGSSSYGIGVVNVGDQLYGSYVLIDNLKINGQLLDDAAPSASRLLGGGRQIDNQGTINWNAGSVILEGGANAAAILNSGTFNINADVDMGSRGGASTLAFRNQSTGQLVKTAGTGRASLGSADSASVDLDNDGLVDVKAGTLALYAPASSAVSTGTFRAVSSAGASLPALEFAGGVAKVGAGAVLEGNIHVATDATLDLITGQKTFRSLALVNDGVINWSAGNIDLQSAVAITNNGLFNAVGSSAVGESSTPAALRMAPMTSPGLPVVNSLQFENNGQLVKTGPGSVYFGVDPSGSGSAGGVGLISGSGLISVEQGLLSFTAGALEGGLDLGIGGISPELRIGNTSYVLASPIEWDGGGGADTSWFNALNWAGDVLPGVGSSVFIGNNINVSFSGSSLVQIASLSAGTDSTFNFGGGSLNVLGSVNLDGLYQQTGGSLTVGGGLFANRFSLSGSDASITGGVTSGGFVVGGGGAASTYSQTGGAISGFASVKIIVDMNGTAALSKNIQLTGTAALPATLSARDRLELDAREGLINLSYASLAATQSNQLSTVDLRAFSSISVVDSSIVAPAAKFELRAANGGGLGALTITRSTLNAAAGSQGGDGGEIRGYGSSIALDQSSMVTSGSTTGGKILLGDSQSASVQVTGTTLVADPPAASGGQIALNGSVVGIGAGTVLNVVGSSGGSLSIGGPTTASVSIASGVVLQASPTALSVITAASPVVGQLTLQVVDLTPPSTSAPVTEPVPQPVTSQPPAEQSPVSTGPTPPADSQPSQPAQPAQPVVTPAESPAAPPPAPSLAVQQVLNNQAVMQAIEAPPLQPVVSQAPPPPPVAVVEPAPAAAAPTPAVDTASTSSTSSSSEGTTEASASTASASTTTAVAPVPQGLDVSLETGGSFEVFGDLSSVSSESLATALLASTGVTISQSAASLSTTEIAQSLVAVFGEAAFEVAAFADSESISISAFGEAMVGSADQQDSVSAMLLGANQANADEAVASTASQGSDSSGAFSSGGDASTSSASSSDGSATSTASSDGSGDSSKNSASTAGAAGSAQPGASLSKQEVTASFQSGEQKSLQDAVTKLGIAGQGSNAVVPTPQQVQTALVRIQQFVRTQLQRASTSRATR